MTVYNGEPSRGTAEITVADSLLPVDGPQLHPADGAVGVIHGSGEFGPGDESLISPADLTRHAAARLVQERGASESASDVWQRPGKMGAEFLRDENHHRS